MAGLQEAKERSAIMGMTKSLNDTIYERLQQSAGFRKAMLGQAVEAMLEGETEVGKSMLRKYVNGTVGFIGIIPVQRNI